MKNDQENELTIILSNLEGSIIRELTLDLLRHQLIFNIKTIIHGSEENHELIFDGVSSYFYVGDFGERRFNPLEMEYADLTEILYIKDGEIKIDQKNTMRKNKPEYSVFANFWIDIWESVLMIEANQVTIDGRVFKVGYPIEN